MQFYIKYSVFYGGINMKGKIIGIVLMVVGLSIIGTALSMKYYSNKKQDTKINEFEKNIERFKKMGDTPSAETINTPGEKSPSQDINGSMGLMLIPKINLKVTIGEGIDMETLKYEVGHFPNTAKPGEKGNFCVAGHRSYTYNESFNKLGEIKIGDEVIIRTIKEEYKYKVYEIKVVEPSEVSVLDSTEDATLTLVTCTPIRVATHRLIIKGKLVEK
jgi:sortase A